SWNCAGPDNRPPRTPPRRFPTASSAFSRSKEPGTGAAHSPRTSSVRPYRPHQKADARWWAVSASAEEPAERDREPLGHHPVARRRGMQSVLEQAGISGREDLQSIHEVEARVILGEDL